MERSREKRLMGFKDIFGLGTREEKLIFEGKTPLAKVITSNFTRQSPVDVTFAKLINYHDRTPQLVTAVSNISELITGTEMTVKTTSEPAQKFLDEWIRRTNFYDKFESIVTTLLICGNAILEKLYLPTDGGWSYWAARVPQPAHRGFRHAGVTSTEISSPRSMATPRTYRCVTPRSFFSIDVKRTGTSG